MKSAAIFRTFNWAKSINQSSEWDKSWRIFRVIGRVALVAMMETTIIISIHSARATAIDLKTGTDKLKLACDLQSFRYRAYIYKNIELDT